MKKINDFPASYCDNCPNREDCEFGGMFVSEEEFYELQARMPELQEIPCQFLAFYLLIKEEQEKRKRMEAYCSEMKFGVKL